MQAAPLTIGRLPAAAAAFTAASAGYLLGYYLGHLLPSPAPPPVSASVTLTLKLFPMDGNSTGAENPKTLKIRYGAVGAEPYAAAVWNAVDQGLDKLFNETSEYDITNVYQVAYAALEQAGLRPTGHSHTLNGCAREDSDTRGLLIVMHATA